MRGASAIEKLLEGHAGSEIRVLIVWEPVLPTDVRAPSSLTLKRISDLRVSQYSDRERLLSHAMGEHDRRSIVWDYIGIYEAGTVWEAGPPKPVFDGRPVVEVIDGARSALDRLLANRHTFALRGLSGFEIATARVPFLGGPGEVFRIVDDRSASDHETLPGIDSCFTVAPSSYSGQ